MPQDVPSPTITKTVGDSTDEAVEVEPLAALAVNVTVTSEVLVLYGATGRGLLRFSDGTTRTVATSLGVPFCQRPGGCGCPAGSNGASLAFVKIPSGAIRIGFSGDRDGVAVSLRGYATKDACDKKPSGLVPPAPCYCPPGPLGLAPDRRV